jgi:hypothetical protein
VLQFHAARVLEAEHLTALRIDAGHDVHDRAVFACGVSGLEHQKDGWRRRESAAENRGE